MNSGQIKIAHFMTYFKKWNTKNLFFFLGRGGGGMEISKMFEFLDNLYLLKKKNPLIIY